jgi:hypothetical protein
VVTDISRRKVLSIVAAGAGGLVAKASGLMPEIALAAEAPTPAGPTSSSAGVTTEGNMIIEQFDRAAIGRALGEAQADKEGRLLWAALERDGMLARPSLAYGSRAHLRSDPQLRGHFVAIPFSDGLGRSAKLYHGLEAQGGLKSFVMRWDDVDQTNVSIFDVQSGTVRRRSTVLLGADASTIVFADGSRRVIRTPGRGRPPGLAAPLADCSLEGVMCSIVCDLVVGLSCAYEATVVCVGLGMLCPPCGVVCEVVAIVMCSVVTSYSCYYVCRPCG